MNYQGDMVNIDKEISKLIQKLWDNGIMTKFSCQGNSIIKSYIFFQTIDGAKQFHSMVNPKFIKKVRYTGIDKNMKQNNRLDILSDISVEEFPKSICARFKKKYIPYILK
jgi:hypothetical protein